MSSARFTSPLDLRASSKEGEWVLLSPLAYVAASADRHTVPAGFVTDLASIPRLLRPVFDPADASRRPAVLHDWLYCLKEHTRAHADGVFLEALEAEGVGRMRRWLMYLGVRAGGWLYWNKRNGLQTDDFVEMPA